MPSTAAFLQAGPLSAPTVPTELALSRPCRRHRPSASAARRARRPENAPGPAYVDSACIDCDTCRWLAPSVFSRVGTQSAVHAQPDEENTTQAAAAAVACPTGSIRGVKVPRAPLFPMAMDDARRVWYLGYTNEASFAASAWLVIAGEAAVMVDVPRYSSALARSVDALLEAEGCVEGLRYIVLTHRDDVVGHVEWAARYPDATRVIHADEVSAAHATDACERKLQLAGGEREELLGGVEVLSVPGHTSGSIAVLDREGTNLFSGDTLALCGETRRLCGFPVYNSGGWALQVATVKSLADEPFLNVYPGHGRFVKFENDEDRRAQILGAVNEW
jgi:glyoxylase-like metal-dependent hydrolase (beta-lactamase superfamily II)/ferredoxin